jgi:hypothetical protein
MNEPGRIKLCWNCQQATKICAMEDVIAALEEMDRVSAEDNDIDSYVLLPENELNKAWDAYERYKNI